MTLFEECVEALSDDFQYPDRERGHKYFFIKYPFEYGNIDKLSEKAKRAAYQLFRFFGNLSFVSSSCS